MIVVNECERGKREKERKREKRGKERRDEKVQESYVEPTSSRQRVTQNIFARSASTVT